jgi:hypothetical protein
MEGWSVGGVLGWLGLTVMSGSIDEWKGWKIGIGG